MIKLVFLMVSIVAFGLLFNTSLSTAITSVTNGGSLVFSSMSIFIDFFSKMFTSMLNFAYIRNILTIFLFLIIMFALVRGLRNGTFSIHDEDVSENATSERKSKVKGKKLVIKGVKK